MATRAEKDTAAARARQGGGQAAKDTAAAKGKQKSSGQSELDKKNEASKNRQRETRERRQAERDVKDRRKELLQGASSTKERREIKAGVYDLNTRPDDNKEGADERIQNDGIDVITNPLDNSGGGGGGGGMPDGTDENDVLYWDGSGWVVFAAPATTGTFVLGVVGGSMTWIEGEEC